MNDLFKRLGEIIDDTVAFHGPYTASPELTDLGNEEAETEHFTKMGRSIVYKTLEALEHHGFNKSSSCEQPMSQSYLDYLNTVSS